MGKWGRKPKVERVRRPVLTDEELKKIMGIDGQEACPYCSTPNWSMYHTKDNPCPKAPKSEKVGYD